MHIGEVGFVVAVQDIAWGDRQIEQAKNVLGLRAIHRQAACKYGRASVRDSVKFEEALQATVGAVAPTHGQECDIDLGLAQGHVDIPIYEHRAGFMSHVAQGGDNGFASTDGSITFNGETTKEHTDLRAGTHAPRVPFIWSSVKKTL
jgi:hypothetical protein